MTCSPETRKESEQTNLSVAARQAANANTIDVVDTNVSVVVRDSNQVETRGHRNPAKSKVVKLNADILGSTKKKQQPFFMGQYKQGQPR